ncbi:MAG TPA: hypothetical protein VH561_16655 [Micromonosporaceae bacterium]|jgi:hypothetical protein
MRIRRVPACRRAGPAVRSAPGLGLAVLICLGALGCTDSDVVSGEATLHSSAGTVDVQCIGRTRAKIVGSKPAKGYTVRMIVAGPSGQASLIFENPKANDFRVAVHCEDEKPHLDEFEVEDTTLSH